MKRECPCCGRFVDRGCRACSAAARHKAQYRETMRFEEALDAVRDVLHDAAVARFVQYRKREAALAALARL